MLLQDLLNRCGWNNKHLQDDIRYRRYGYILFILSIVECGWNNKHPQDGIGY